MKHAAASIVSAVAAALEAFVDTPVNIYEHRATTLADDHDELPAISVDFGEDAPYNADGAAGFDFNQSILTVNVTIVVTGPVEKDVREDLLSLRAQVHKAILTPPRLNLAGVLSVNYGGAEPPELLFEGDSIIAALVCVWGVLYETPANNPEI